MMDCCQREPSLLTYGPADKKAFLQYYFGQTEADRMESLEQMSFVVAFWNAMWAVLQTGLPDGSEVYKNMAEYIFKNLKMSL
jgi:hypothetical protein